MSAAQTLKSMKNAPRLDKATYDRWSAHFLDVLSLFNLEKYDLEDTSQLVADKVKLEIKVNLEYQKQDRNIRVALSQLTPDTAFNLVNSSFTSKIYWENLKQFNRPNSNEDVDDLLQQFWGLIPEDEINIDEFVRQMSEIRGKIFLINNNTAPSKCSMKKRLLGHFIKCYNGFYMSTVISLRDPTITFQVAVSLIRASQEVYKELHPPSIVVLVDINRNNDNLSSPAAQSKSAVEEKGNPNTSKNASLNGAAGELQIGAWMMEEQSLISIRSVCESDLVFDTGTTNHTLNDQRLLVRIDPVEKLILKASGDSNPVSRVGNVEFKVFNYENEKLFKVIKMEDFWYVPKCTKNLVSGVWLLSKGYQIKSSNGGLSVMSGDSKIIATAKQK
ncbi:hypothetical protein EV44_g3455 [Erysiphe necator]|uniref:Retrovirus-related Pol polyprotein from transposon TNT 1-94-like beta-barrel domain-containing protein n=1 Tax=Uncinula necator TaxID=52586 RepID=A0A0B1PGH7_UNCNE|nr:hypothetical protein EV44_g3455 [Erysiphe necator]